jgi:predicted NBD/HSP70 family sugar kinase
VEPCSTIIEKAAYTAAAVVAGTQCLVDPDAIVIGGSVATNQPGFVRKIGRYANGMMEPYRFKFPKGLRILRSELGQYNGILGAVGLLLDRNGES